MYRNWCLQVVHDKYAVSKTYTSSFSKYAAFPSITKCIKMCTLLHRSKFNSLAKNRFRKYAIVLHYLHKFWSTHCRSDDQIFEHDVFGGLQKRVISVDLENASKWSMNTRHQNFIGKIGFLYSRKRALDSVAQDKLHFVLLDFFEPSKVFLCPALSRRW